jgi:CHAT domain-containing protein
VPHYVTHIFPFHALEYAGKPLLDTFIVDYAPSLTVLLVSQAWSKMLSERNKVLVIANPDGSLPFTLDEAAQIKKVFEGAEVRAGGRADAPSVLDLMKDHDVVHFACHADFGENSNRDIALRLAPGFNHSGLLTLREIIGNAQIRLGSLVVLSACRTARTKLEEIDEFVGLPSGFMVAGASALVGSLWPVDDRSTALLMGRFYQELARGSNHIAALRTAQLWLRDSTDLEIRTQLEEIEVAWAPERARDVASRDLIAKAGSGEGYENQPYSSPYYWAGFFAIGL